MREVLISPCFTESGTQSTGSVGEKYQTELVSNELVMVLWTAIIRQPLLKSNLPQTPYTSRRMPVDIFPPGGRVDRDCSLKHVGNIRVPGLTLYPEHYS